MLLRLWLASIVFCIVLTYLELYLIAKEVRNEFSKEELKICERKSGACENVILIILLMSPVLNIIITIYIIRSHSKYVVEMRESYAKEITEAYKSVGKEVNKVEKAIISIERASEETIQFLMAQGIIYIGSDNQLHVTEK